MEEVEIVEVVDAEHVAFSASVGEDFGEAEVRVRRGDFDEEAAVADIGEINTVKIDEILAHHRADGNVAERFKTRDDLVFLILGRGHKIIIAREGAINRELRYNKVMRKFIPDNVKLIPEEAKKVFQGEIWAVYQWSQEMFDGSFETFEMLRRPDTVKILPIVTAEEARELGFKAKATDGRDDSGGVDTSGEMRLIVTKQEQPRKDCFYDYPGGRMDEEDADELVAAKRELREETGLSFRNWKLIKVEQPFSKIDWLVYTFLATGLLGRTEQSLDAGEKIEVQAMSFEEVRQLIADGEARYMQIKELDERVRLDEVMDLPELYKY